MKKLFKKFFSVIIVVAISMCSHPPACFVGIDLPKLIMFSAEANAEEIPTSGTHGDNLTWSFDESTATLTISGTGEMNEELGYPWFNDAVFDKVVTVQISNGVTSVGEGAFYLYPNLTTVILPESIKTIGAHSFLNCQKLSEINIPSSVNCINNYAFAECTSLTEITMPDGVVSIGDYTFWECTSLKEIIIPDSVSTIGEAAFGLCDSVENIVLGSGLTSIGESAFLGTTSLKSVTVSNDVVFDTFIFAHDEYGSYSLENVIFTEEVTQINPGAFAYSPKLSNVTLPYSVTTIGAQAFYDCQSLSEIYLFDNITHIGELAFCGCPLFEITLPANLKTIERGAFASTSLSQVAIPSGIISIGDYAFAYCDYLKKVFLPIGEYTISETAFERTEKTEPLPKVELCFEGNGEEWAMLCKINPFLSEYNVVLNSGDIGGACGNECYWTIVNGTLYINGNGDMFDYTHEALPPWSTYSSEIIDVQISNGITRIGDCAFYCFSDTSKFILPNTLTSIGEWAFYGCYDLSEINIPYTVTSIGQYAFAVCTALESVTLPNGIVQLNQATFYGCSNLKNVDLPDSLTLIGLYAFYNCDSLTQITIPNSVEIIGQYAFYDCDGISGLIIPDSTTETGSYSFYSCDSLQNVWFGENISWIGRSAFERCTNLNTLHIPLAMANINYYAFDYCKNIKNVNYVGKLEDWKKINIKAGNSYLTQVAINYDCFHEHSYSPLITKDPTCQIKGVLTYTCDCGDSYTEEIAIIEHISGDWVTENEATCTQNGLLIQKCIFCGLIMERYVIPIVSHSEGDWKTVTEPTCNGKGLKEKRCTGCSCLLESEEIDLINHIEGEFETTIEPTCQREGEKIAHCSECGIILSVQNIPKVDHIDNNDDYYCDACEIIIDKKIIVTLSTPSTRTLQYGESVKLYAFTNILPENYKIKWKVEGNGVSIKPSSTGNSCTITSLLTGNVVIKAYVVDSNGYTVTDENGKQISDSEYLYSEANLWLKIVYFFKKLFCIGM